MMRNNKITLDSIYYENDFLTVAFYISANLFCEVVFEEGLTPYQVFPKKYFDKIDKNMLEDSSWNFFVLNKSDKLDWYYKNAKMFWDNFTAKHYAMLIGESFIEVLAMKTPILKINKKC
jgi:hypothetical protein